MSSSISVPPAMSHALSAVRHAERFFHRHFRTRRHKWLAAEFRNCRTVIDVGGTEGMWDTVGFRPRVTLVNLEPQKTVGSSFEYVQGDGRKLGFPDVSFDLAFSNSVIEHAGGFDDQRLFAKELMRVGRRIYCQTPNRWFPIEFHFLGLFIHWLPQSWFTYFVHRYLTLRGLLTRPNEERSLELRKSVRLLTRKELQELFPGCRIRTERFLGFPKSFVAWK